MSCCHSGEQHDRRHQGTEAEQGRGQHRLRHRLQVEEHRGDVDATYLALGTLVDRIRDDDTLHRVEQVMAHSPWSARTTQRVFRRYVGVPVKWVLCRYRLQHAALKIETDPAVDFADLAVRLGWYDQAHFINDFRSMLGCTPGEYATRHG